MKFQFSEWIYPEEFDFNRVVRDAGLAHQVDGDELQAKVFDGGTRELLVNLEIDTETGIITVAG